ncbi:MAG: tryptophan--tRNA ligase, partial [Beijerinckiaceae bacterium]
FAALDSRTKADVLAQFGGGQFSTFKNALADLSVAKLSPIAAEMRRLLNDPAEIDRILCDGGDRARAIAEVTMREAREILGFIQRP